MVVFHSIFNLRVFFGIKSINYYQGFWFYESRISAIIFIALVGVVSAIICQRKTFKIASQKNAYRGLRLIALGLLITLITFLLERENTIWFGILHFLGLSTLISIPLCRYKRLNVLLAIILFIGYFPIKNLYTENYFGVIFGIMPPDFASYDHYSLIPWLGFVLIGIALGNWIYANNKSPVKRQPSPPEKGLAVIGKYSLWIYLIHQPILLTMMWLYFQFV